MVSALQHTRPPVLLATSTIFRLMQTRNLAAVHNFQLFDAQTEDFSAYIGFNFIHSYQTTVFSKTRDKTGEPLARFFSDPF
jgi:hypothetical protein